MKKSHLLIISVISLLISSCGGPSKDIFKMVPETALAVVTVHPGNLIKKGKIQEVNFLKEIAAESDFSQMILENPESSGIEMDTYSSFFVFGKSPRYGCMIMPLKNKEDFENFMNKMEEESKEEFIREEMGKYQILRQDEAMMIYDKKISMMLFKMNYGEGDLKMIAENLLNLENESCLLSDKDFNYFLGKQKDINAWFTSTNINSVSGAFDLEGAMDLFGGIKNNYGHVFLDFQDGEMSLSTNLRFNQNIKETIDKYNFLDEDAIKDILKYLPSKDVLFVGNTNVDPDKVFGLLKFINRDFEDTFDEMAENLEMDPEEIKKSMGGEAAFSLNGFQNFNLEKYEDSVVQEKLPQVIFATRLKSEKVFEDFLSLATRETEVKPVEGYYKVINKGIPVYLILKDKDLVVSNKEELISEIDQKGMIKENVTKSDFQDILTKDPVCFFLNLDQEEYSGKVQEFMDEEMGDEVSEVFDRFGDKLKSLSVSVSLEEWEVRIVFKDSDVNSLHALLSQVDK